MSINHETSTTLRINANTAAQESPALAGFVICPVGMNFVGSPVASQLAIYQMAYEQAQIAASQQWWGYSRTWSQN